MEKKNFISRRKALKAIGAIGASVFLGSKTADAEEKPTTSNAKCSLSEIRKTISKKVYDTPFIDTHEHLLEEKERLTDPWHRQMKSKDWSVIFGQYTSADMQAAGMPLEIKKKFFSPNIDPVDKWKLLEPYWPLIKNTGYGQLLRITIKKLYDVDELSAKTVKKVQAGYEKLARPGFYKYILQDLAKIESCHVNSNKPPFIESDMPTLLMQDIAVSRMIDSHNAAFLTKPTGIKVSTLADWHNVIDWWFNKYGKYAVAIKCANAYQRDINFEKVSAEKVEATFKNKMAGKTITDSDEKAIQDHLFWYAVEKATQNNLPVKIHTGYTSDVNRLNLERIGNHPAAAAKICFTQRDKDTKFVLFHICYPYYEPIITLAKQYTNASIDMCWAWIMNPVGAKDFLKKFLVCAQASKIFTFGGDCRAVEPVLGHATMAREGIILALSELVEEGYLRLDDALELTDPIMHGNARRTFNVTEKEQILKNVKWG